MGEEYPNEAAYDANQNPLFTSDHKIAYAADVVRSSGRDLYTSNRSLYTGAVYDGSGNRVRGAVYPSEYSGYSDRYDPVDDLIGMAVAGAFIAFIALISGPLDRWLMEKAKGQSQRAEELGEMAQAVQGLNLGALLMYWIWPFFFLRPSLALLVVGLMVLPMTTPCTIPVTLVVMALIVTRGNEWAWYSGKWKTVEDFSSAKRRWVHNLITIYVVFFILAAVADAVTGAY